jgi:hypothetical protein
MDEMQDKMRGKARADELGWGILIVETRLGVKLTGGKARNIRKEERGR